METIPVLVSLKGGGMFRMGRDFLWMTPLADTILFVLAGSVLLAVAGLSSRARSRSVVMGVFAGLATLAVGLSPERLYPAAILLLAVGVGVQVGRRTRGPVRNPRVLGVSVGMAFLIVAVSAARVELKDRSIYQYWHTRLPAPKAEAPNVVVLILDTVRGASLDFLRDLRPQSTLDPVKTPALEELAARSVLFTKAIAPSPWTLPSHGSMFTGRWANRLSGPGLPGSEASRGLDPGMPTLAQVLRGEGYSTAGFVGNLLFAYAETGLGLGFLTYKDYEVSPAQVFLSCSIGRRLARTEWLRSIAKHHEVLNRKGADTVVEQFLDWQETNQGRPFFAFLNFFDAHEPYFPVDSVKRSMPPGSRWDEFTHYVGAVVGASAVRTDKWGMDPAEREAHASGYHANIQRMDAEIQRMLDELDRRGVLEHTVVIVAGDHGEQLGEHDLFGHSNSLYLPSLHVPLMVFDARGDGKQGVVRSIVSLRDMAATVLDFAGIDAASVEIPGNSLARYWTQSDEEREDLVERPSETAFSVLYRGSPTEAWYPVERGPAMYSLVDSAYHYILNGDGTEELFDLRADPSEMSNIARSPALQAVLASFRTRLLKVAPEVAGR
jgi:arylsulfatase A-like enzyme